MSSTLYNVMDLTNTVFLQASLWHFMLKTVFLLKLASGRRRNETHVLSCDEKCYRFGADGGLVNLITGLGSSAHRSDFR